VVHVLAGDQALEELDHVGRPAGDITRQLLQHGDRALAPTIGNGVRDLGAAADDGRRDAVQRTIADQIADVRDRPLGAGLDERVIV
jgi:hypothetical protein